MYKFLSTILFTILSTGLGAQDLDTIILTDITSDKQYEFSSLKSAKGTVIIFFGNRCAYNSYYIQRLKKISSEFASEDIRFILVNANQSDVIIEESPENMKRFLDKNTLKLPYLIDVDQVLKNTLGASRSPEVFVLDAKLQVFYSGAIDDSPQSEGDVSHPYLEEAILSLLQNKPLTVNRVRPVGCLIQ